MAGVALPASIAAAAPAKPSGLTISSSGLHPGAIKHVWLIILENKSYDATFTGLNQNSYLWKTLPQQGVLLKKYYGTGHSSQDNYLAMVSGQSPNEPGTSTDTYYNHYSWLRTMEDIFSVGEGHDHSPLPAGTVSGGLDGQGHLGYAAQPGLRAFGPDVFNHPEGYGQGGNRLDAITIPNGPSPGSPWAQTSLAVGTPLLALIVGGGSAWYLRRRRGGRSRHALSGRS